jgi:hypothetical protein
MMHQAWALHEGGCPVDLALQDHLALYLVLPEEKED